MAMKKGDLVRVVQEKLTTSLEAQASDPRWPQYVLQTPGEIVDLRADYALVKFAAPTPNVWLRVDQLAAYAASA